MVESNNKKIINAWCMYDWANSAYNLVITTTFFPIYFSGITTAAYGNRVPFLGRTFKASALYDYALAFAYLAIAVLLPILSRSEEHTSELQSHLNLVCRLLLEK